MSSSPPKHSLSLPTSGTLPPVLPTPSSSTSASGRSAPQLRHDLEQQLAEKEKQLQDTRSGIEKNVLVRQIRQLKEKLKEVEHHQNNPILNGDAPHQQKSPSMEHPPPMTMDKLRNMEREPTGYRVNPLSPGLTALRKEKLLGQRSNGLEPLPSPSTSTLLPPVHGHDSTSILPLPPSITGSTPTKRRSKVPNADRRNTDIEFATEIGQGLLLEVRKMQALLQEKEEQLRTLEIQKADLERTAEAMAKQLRQREENEEKLKEETWNLELAKQELTISVTELQQNLHKAHNEHNKLSKQLNQLTSEIEQLRDREEKLSATIETMKTRHEQDMSAIRRQSAGLQREKTEQTKQIEALTSELAIVKAQTRINKRSSGSESDPHASSIPRGSRIADDSLDPSLSKDASSPNTTPPPSPKQQTPARRQAMEVETLKTSLGHAHRMVSNLRSNLHKEKTEKFELKKLLVESQETIEQFQNDPRLWVDAGAARVTSPTESSLRRSHKAKKRTLTRKPRGMSHHSAHHGNYPSSHEPRSPGHTMDGEEEESLGEESLGEENEDSDVSKKRRKQKTSSVSRSDPSAYAYSSMESSDSDLSLEGDREQLGHRTSGFTSLSLELSQSQSRRSYVDASTNTEPTDHDVDKEHKIEELASAGAGVDLALGTALGVALNSALSAKEDTSNQNSLEDVLEKKRRLFSTHTLSAQSSSPSTPSLSLASPPPPPPFSLPTEWSETVLDAIELPPVAGNTTALPTAAITHDIGVQPTRTLSDVGVQSDGFQGVDCQVQTTRVRVDSGVQSETVHSVDRGVDSLCLGVDSSVQSEVAQGVDSEVQSETVQGVDSAVQNTFISVDSGVQSETVQGVDCEVQNTRVRVDSGVQSETVHSVDCEVQNTRVRVDSGVQSETVHSVDSEVQSDTLQAAPIEVQSDIAKGIDSEANTAPISVDSGVQSEATHGIDSEVQSDTIQGIDSEAQSEATHGIDSGIQYDLPYSDPSAKPVGAAIEVETQHDAPQSLDQGTQHDALIPSDPKTEPVTVVDASVQYEVPIEDTQKNILFSLPSPSQEETPAELYSNPPFSSSPETLLSNKDAKFYSQEEADALIATAVSAALAAFVHDELNDAKTLAQDSKRHTCDMSSNATGKPGLRKNTTPSLADLAARGAPSLRSSPSVRSSHDFTPPPRPSSPPPASLLSRVNYAHSLSAYDNGSVRSSVSNRTDKGKSAIYSLSEESSPQYGTAFVDKDIIYQGRDHRQIHRSLSGKSIESMGQPPGGDRMSNQFNRPFNSTHLQVSPSGANGVDSGAIALVTDTMIGEWLLKYTRKHVGQGFSENRHQRYFWIHPYTRTLYWSTQAPGVESNVNKAKSAFIEGVSTVPNTHANKEDGLPDVSLMIKTNTRVIKITAPTLERHKVWLDSLTYLLARAQGESDKLTGSDPAGAIPALERSVSMSSGNASLLSRKSFQQIQGLFRGKLTAQRPFTFKSFQSLCGTPNIAQNMHVHEEGEDDPLEDVRMCCDGKHHVSN